MLLLTADSDFPKALVAGAREKVGVLDGDAVAAYAEFMSGEEIGRAHV